MDRQQFFRFLNRVGICLNFVPEDEETTLVQMLRASLYNRPERDSKIQLAEEQNKLFLHLGPAKSAYLFELCDEVNVNFDENMRRGDADRLWEHLLYKYDHWYQDQLPV